MAQRLQSLAEWAIGTGPISSLAWWLGRATRIKGNEGVPEPCVPLAHVNEKPRFGLRLEFDSL